MLSIFALPLSLPSTRLASKSVTSPVNVATAYGTSKATREWTVSACHAPVGMPWVCSMVLITRFLLILDDSILDCSRIVARNLARANICVYGPFVTQAAMLVGAVDRPAAADDPAVDLARDEVWGVP